MIQSSRKGKALRLTAGETDTARSDQSMNSVFHCFHFIFQADDSDHLLCALFSAETDIIGFIGTLAFIWLGILVFFGTMVTHDYSLGKNFVTILGTLIAMVFIMFIAVLFTTLIGKIVSLITNIVTEIQYRM